MLHRFKTGLIASFKYIFFGMFGYFENTLVLVSTFKPVFGKHPSAVSYFGHRKEFTPLVILFEDRFGYSAVFTFKCSIGNHKLCSSIFLFPVF